MPLSRAEIDRLLDEERARQKQEWHRRDMTAKWRVVLTQMKIGDSFTLPENLKKAVRHAGDGLPALSPQEDGRWALNDYPKFTIKKVAPGEHRCTRVR